MPLLLSVDDKAKVKVGIPAVSKYIFSRKYFEVNHKMKINDHDFPIGAGFLIVPSGNSYLINLNE